MLQFDMFFYSQPTSIPEKRSPPGQEIYPSTLNQLLFLKREAPLVQKFTCT